MFLMNVDDAAATEHFMQSANSKHKHIHNYANWPWHRCLARHSSWHKAKQGGVAKHASHKKKNNITSFSSRLRRNLRSLHSKFDTVSALDETDEEENNSEAHDLAHAAARMEKAAPTIDTVPDKSAEATIPAAPASPTQLGAEYHAATRAFDDHGRPTRVRQPVNVPGGPKLSSRAVLKEAAQYMNDQPDTALAILKRLAPQIGASPSLVQKFSHGEPLLRSLALQANLDSVREQLRAARVINADKADRLSGLATLLLNTARGGAITQVEGMRVM